MHVFFVTFVCRIRTESSLKDDILETEDKSCVGKKNFFEYSKLDGMEIAVDDELWLFVIIGKFAINGEEFLSTSSSERRFDEYDDEFWVGK